jgi:NADH:ubiquinone oxidoreductase subunit K
VLFGVGMLGVVTRRSALTVFMCVELMLNAATSPSSPSPASAST